MVIFVTGVALKMYYLSIATNCLTFPLSERFLPDVFSTTFIIARVPISVVTKAYSAVSASAVSVPSVLSRIRDLTEPIRDLTETFREMLSSVHEWILVNCQRIVKKKKGDKAWSRDIRNREIRGRKLREFYCIYIYIHRDGGSVVRTGRLGCRTGEVYQSLALQDRW